MKHLTWFLVDIGLAALNGFLAYNSGFAGWGVVNIIAAILVLLMAGINLALFATKHP
jgi:hypothetical protein